MSTNSPILSAGPAVGFSIDDLRHHIQLIYQKLGNHTQAFGMIQQAVAKATNAPTGRGSSSGSSSGPSSQDITNAVNNAVSQALATIPTGIAVNNQVGKTSYSTQTGDSDALLVFSSASAMAVTLPNEQPPWGTFLANIGASGSGTLTVTPVSGTISYAGTSGASSMPIPPSSAALVAFDGTNWQAMIIEASSGGTITAVVAGTGLAGGGSSGSVTLSLSTPVSVANGGTGTSSPGLIAGTNVTITGSWPNQTIAASGGGGGGYIKGNITVTPSGPGTYQGSGTITGATVGSAVLVGVTNSTEASEVSNLLGWVTSTNNVTIQATFSSGVLGLNLPVVVFV